MDEDLQRAIEAAHAAYTDVQWEVLGPRVRTKLIYEELRRIDAVRVRAACDHPAPSW
jgi:hypothetical protein